MSTGVSRRGFLREAPGAAVLAVAQPAMGMIVELPKKAWVIMAQSWENHDEGASSIEGGSTTGLVYYDEKQARDECARLIAEFCAIEDPHDFQLHYYLPEDCDEEDYDHDTLWKMALEGGLADPYTVEELGAVPKGATGEQRPGSR